MSTASAEHDPAWEESAGAAYPELVTEQLEEERRRKTSLEQRGVFIVTSAGTFLSVVAALVTLTERTERLKPSDVVSEFLRGALVLFVVSAVCGIAANSPLR